MNVCLDALTDENLQYLVKCNLEFFLEPIKKNQKQYKQYTSRLGSMNKKSMLVPQNLPKIAVKLYNHNDSNYVKAMKVVAEKYFDLFIELVNKTLDREVTIEEFCNFSDEQVVDMLKKIQVDEQNKFEQELFKIQMKLIGFPDVDDRMLVILSKYGIKEQPKKKVSISAVFNQQYSKQTIQKSQNENDESTEEKKLVKDVVENMDIAKKTKTKKLTKKIVGDVRNFIARTFKGILN